MAEEATDKERQDALWMALYLKGSLTVDDAWEVGYGLGFYRGGDGGQAKTDLQALVQHNRAQRHDGFWRHINEHDDIRRKYKRWSDYWTPRGIPR